MMGQPGSNKPLSAIIGAALNTADRKGSHLAAAYLAQALAIAKSEEQRTSTLPRPH